MFLQNFITVISLIYLYIMVFLEDTKNTRFLFFIELDGKWGRESIKPAIIIKVVSIRTRAA